MNKAFRIASACALVACGSVPQSGDDTSAPLDASTLDVTTLDATSDVGADALPSADGNVYYDGGLPSEDAYTPCIPSGVRQPFNTLASATNTGCVSDEAGSNPCQNGFYQIDEAPYLRNFAYAGEQITCSGTTACVSHVGVITSGYWGICQGTWDVYCDSTKVGTIDTLGSMQVCWDAAVSNGCDTTFEPRTCSSIQLVAQTGSGLICCSGTLVDSTIVGVSAW
jgi:hypothetical protein